MANGRGSCPHRGTNCIEEKCTHWDTKSETCVYSEMLDILKKVKKVLDDILLKT